MYRSNRSDNVNNPQPTGRSEAHRERRGAWRTWILLALLVLLACGVGAAFAWNPHWWQALSATIFPHGEKLEEGDDHEHAATDDHDHEPSAGDDHEAAAIAAPPPTAADEHNHEEAGDVHAEDEAHTESAATLATDHVHDEAESLTLSAQAKANIGVELSRVQLQTFERTVTVPGMVVERPGWTTVEVTAPMTGVVIKVHCLQGEAIEPGQPLFDLRLTHEDLLQVQTDFLQTVEELDVIGREVARLEKVAADGVIPGKSFLERKYDQQRQEARLRTLREALLLHGLTAEQVQAIMETRTLLQSLTIRAPDAPDHPAGTSNPLLLQVRTLNVTPGKFVTAGDVLCKLANYEELHIEGQAFERDLSAINEVVEHQRDVSVSLDAKGASPVLLEGLKILYMDDVVDAQSRTVRFYVSLRNQFLREDKSPTGHRFVYWQFRPGQRCQISLPVETWSDRIVLPIEAVANDGIEYYVFEANGDHFDRRTVHVEYRDEKSAVIANDGALKVGTQVARSAAHYLQMALKNKSGGAVDPHAGHNH
jgi:multidrug efflux pump subunit AcrA (membrane-fusion protein)